MYIYILKKWPIYRPNIVIGRYSILTSFILNVQKMCDEDLKDFQTGQYIFVQKKDTEKILVLAVSYIINISVGIGPEFHRCIPQCARVCVCVSVCGSMPKMFHCVAVRQPN